MEKESRESFSELCNFLFVKDGNPVCIFRIAEHQPCGYLSERACYYRGGPFNSRGAQLRQPIKKPE